MLRTAAAPAPDGPVVDPAAQRSPAAARVPGRRWRDWRLLVGVLLVLGSAIVGARVVVAADDTMDVWAADAELLPGAALTRDTASPLAVRLTSEVNPYLAGPIPEGYVLVREVGRGELIPASAVASRAELDETVRLVAVSPSLETLPGDLSAGDRVDVWVVPDVLGESDRRAVLLAGGVDVSSVPPAESGFGAATGGARVVLSLERGPMTADELTDLTAQLVAASAAGRVVLTADPAPR